MLLVLCVTFVIMCISDNVGVHCAVGDIHYGVDKYIEYREGNISIILSAPHGGWKRPWFEPNFYMNGGGYVNETCVYNYDTMQALGLDATQKHCPTVNLSDWKSNKLATGVYDYIASQQSGWYPHLIVNRLHRTRLDPNRCRERGTFNISKAMKHWDEYHDFINQAKNIISGRALLIDFHSQAQRQRIELGYSISGSKLASQSTNSTPLASSICKLANNSTLDFVKLLSGEHSLGAYLQGHVVGGYNTTTVPSPDVPFPGEEGYFAGRGGFGGAYITPTHGSKAWPASSEWCTGEHVDEPEGLECNGVVDAIQVESPSDFVKIDENREEYIPILAQAIIDFYKYHYPV